MSQNIHSVRDVLSLCSFPGMWIRAHLDDADFYLQVSAEARCNVSGDTIRWTGRKWKLSVHMTDSEIVQTAFKAVLTALEHEAREQFLYRGVSIFDPHYDVERLVALRRDPASISEREPMPADKSFTGE